MLMECTDVLSNDPLSENLSNITEQQQKSYSAKPDGTLLVCSTLKKVASSCSWEQISGCETPQKHIPAIS